MEFFSKVRGVIKKDYPLKHLTWIKIGGNAEYFFKPYDLDDLVFFLMENNSNLNHFVIGAGSNLLIKDGNIEGVVIKLGRNFTDICISESDKTLSAYAGCLNINLANFCLANSIKGFEFLVGIPGTVGGGVAMNAGAYGSDFSDIVLGVHGLDQLGNKLFFSKDEIGFAYRTNKIPHNIIFTKVVFKLEYGSKDVIANAMENIQDMRSKTQPIKEKTCGSVFVNLEKIKAWQLIDELGFRGARIGDVSISNLHSNFIINHGNGTSKDAEFLLNSIKKKAKEVFNINLDLEIKIVGNELTNIN